MINITQDITVASAVTANIKTADVFKKYGIDFCCGGGKTIQKVCLKNNIDANKLVLELQDAIDERQKTYDYANWELDFLIDHINTIHHTYVENSIPLILEYAEKVAKVHGHHYKEVVEVLDLFYEVANELTAHMKKEELILFPYVKKVNKAQKEKDVVSLPSFETVLNPIHMMETEHENAGELFKEIARLTNNYTPPENACNTFRALYAKLEEFEQDLHLHIHLENNILFPKAIELEKSTLINN